uniref:SEC7 domain-containing protein n=1 Tax=Heterorhabditis bacteriophora TaxID=37862 RepID=A0A1I7W689_HETBA
MDSTFDSRKKSSTVTVNAINCASSLSATNSPSRRKISNTTHRVHIGFQLFKRAVGVLYCFTSEFSSLVTTKYLELFAFSGLRIDAALHEVHTLTCALLLLNSDLHGVNMGKKMAVRDFINNLGHTGVQYKRDLLKALYTSIKENEIIHTNDSVKKMTFSSPYKRLFSSQAQVLEIDPESQVEYKCGYIMRKCVYDSDGTKSKYLNFYQKFLAPVGRRGWREWYVRLRGLVLYLGRDDSDRKRSRQRPMLFSESSYGTHFPSLRIFPISCNRLETVALSTPSCSSWVYDRFSSNNDFKASAFDVCGVPRRCRSLTSKSRALKRWNQYLQVLSILPLLELVENTVRNMQFLMFNNAILLHHAFAEPANDYSKKQFIFRLRTANLGEFLFQTTSAAEVDDWVLQINFVCARFSSRALPPPVCSNGTFSRTRLPKMPSSAPLMEQIKAHENAAWELCEQLARVRDDAPPLKTKGRLVEEFFFKERYLTQEVVSTDNFIIPCFVFVTNSSQIPL